VIGSRRHRPGGAPAAVTAVAVTGAVFLALPLVGLLQRAPWTGLTDHLGGRVAADALRLSLFASFAATAVALVLGVPLAWVSSRATGPARAALRALTLLPLVLPPVVGGVALLAAFGRRGLLGGWLDDAVGTQLAFTTTGVVLAEAFVALPFVVLATEGGLRALDRRYEDAAATLGAGRWLAFRRVTLPLVAPAVAAGAVLAWARALGEFGATITFAGNVPGRTQTLPLAAYLALEQGDADQALALSLVLVALSVVVLVALRDRWLPTART
jgi:molybdate transport system permease protein